MKICAQLRTLYDKVMMMMNFILYKKLALSRCQFLDESVTALDTF